MSSTNPSERGVRAHYHSPSDVQGLAGFIVETVETEGVGGMRTVYQQTIPAASTAVPASATGTTVFDQFLTIPAGTLQTGDRIYLSAQFAYVVVGPVVNGTLTLDLGGITLFGGASSPPVNNQKAVLDYEIIVVEAGVSGSLALVVLGEGSYVSGAYAPGYSAGVGIPLDTTPALNIEGSITWNALGDADDNARLAFLTVSVVRG